MEKSKKEIVNKLLKQEITKEEESELLDLLVDKPIAVDVEKQEESSLTFGEKLADKLSAIAGSWTFILIFSLFFSFSKNFHSQPTPSFFYNSNLYIFSSLIFFTNIAPNFS